VRLLTLYHREGCHLCEDMERELAPLLAARGWRLERVDVDTDPMLARQYGAEVPVLVHEGREICRHRLDRAALEAVLTGP